MEEINSDDELAREIILSPLLPTTNVDKVLEKANMDYECESQRECLDILDSIDEDLGIEDPKESLFRDSCQPSKEKIIPQVDGSGEDPSFSVGAVETASNSGKKIEDSILMERQAVHDTGISSAGKRKVKSSSWGNLPFSNAKEDGDNVHANFSVYYGVSPECNYQSPDDSGFNRQVENCLSTSKKIEHLKDAGVPHGCSVRDLMRKKRKSQVLPQKEQKLNVISCLECTRLHFSDDEESTMQHRSCTMTSDKSLPEEVGNPVLEGKETISRSYIESKSDDKDANCIASHCWGRTLRACLSEKALESFCVDDTITKATVTQSTDRNEHELREDADLSTVDTRTSTSLNTLTFHEKPDNLNCDDKASEDDRSAEATVCHAFPRQKNIHKVPGRFLVFV